MSHSSVLPMNSSELEGWEAAQKHMSLTLRPEQNKVDEDWVNGWMKFHFPDAFKERSDDGKTR